jgi:DNA repair exonuclease SbcCD nuclease subunit
MVPISSHDKGFIRVTRRETRLSGIRKVIVAGDPGCTVFGLESQAIFGDILSREADLIALTGDLTFLGDPEEYEAILGFCARRAKAPVYSLSGNHDDPHYDRFLGLTDYVLVLDHHFLVFISNSDAVFSQGSLTLLRETLEKHQGKTCVLFLHVPPPAEIVPRGCFGWGEWEKLMQVLEPHRRSIGHIFAGHVHGYHGYRLDGYPVTISAGAGAAMIHTFKEPGHAIHHFVLVDLEADGAVKASMIPVKSGDTVPV